MKNILFILVFILSNSSFSIGTYELFMKYIPKNVFLDVENGKSIKDNLEYYADLNPDLIYCYINYLDLKLNKNIDNKVQNGYYILLDLTNKSLLKRAGWLSTRVNAFENISDSQVIIWNINNFSHDFIVDQSKLQIPPATKQVLDTNKMNYFSYIYFLRDNSQEYNEKINYFELSKKLISEKTRDINYRIEELNSLNKEQQLPEIKGLLAFWYLIGKGVDNKYLLCTDKENFENIYRNIPTVSSLKYQITVGAGYYPFVNIYNKEITTKFRDKISIEIPSIIEFNLPLNLDVKSMESISLGINIPLRKELKSFCYLEFRFSYNIMGINISQPDAKKSLYSNSYYYDVDSTTNNIGYTAKPAVGLKEYFMGIQVSTPLVYLGSSFSIEAGLYYSYYKFNIDYLLYKEYTKYKRSPPQFYKFFDRLFCNNIKESKSRINPLVNFQYKLFNHLNIYLNTVWLQKAVVTPSIGLEGIINL